MSEQKIKVKTTHVGCCGIEDNTVYDAIGDALYMRVLLPNGVWTGHHFNNGRFIIIDDQALKDAEELK